LFRSEDTAGWPKRKAGALFPMPETENSTGDLFPPPEARELEHADGILPSQLLRDAIERTREIQSLEPILDDQIQPASLDLRLGDVAHRVRASFLPGPDHKVSEKLRALSLHTLDLRNGAVLRKGLCLHRPFIGTSCTKVSHLGSCQPKEFNRPS